VNLKVSCTVRNLDAAIEDAMSKALQYFGPNVDVNLFIDQAQPGLMAMDGTILLFEVEVTVQAVYTGRLATARNTGPAIDPNNKEQHND